MLYLVCTSLFDMVLNGVSYQVKGAAYNLNGFNGRLLVGVNSQLQLYKLATRDDGTQVGSCHS